MPDDDDPVERRSLVDSLAASLGSEPEARWIVDDAVGDTSVVANRKAAARARSLARRRAAGEPLQYVLGHWPFRELDLLVDERALIPRPETEWVTDVALAELDRLLGVGAAETVVDLGTGTGAIALSIALERAGRALRVIGTDLDSATLELAALNVARVTERHRGAEAVDLCQGSWWQALDERDRGRVSLAVSNPPYVAEVEWALLDPVVRDHEPRGALVSGAGSDGTPGLADVEAILAGAGVWLARPAATVIELAPSQADAAARRHASRVERGAGPLGPRGAAPCPRGAVHMTSATGIVGPGDVGPLVDALRSGGVVGIPTDTVYGLAAALEPTAIGRVFEAKGRPADLALPVLIGGPEQVAAVASAFPASASRLTQRFWPGPLTVVVRARRAVGALIGGDGRTVGIRWPDHPFVEELCLAAGPLAVTSANRHGEPPCTEAAELRRRFAAQEVALVVDGGECSGQPSTVVDCSGRHPRCVREGALGWDELEGLLG